MAKITEDYVSFETAKLLKEKGFEGYSIITIYDENAASAYIKGLQEKHLPYSSDDPKLKEFYYTRPTLQMACKWLREIHNIDIIPFHEKLPNDCYWCRIEKYPYIEYIQEPIYKKYEESLDAAIKYCLKHSI